MPVIPDATPVKLPAKLVALRIPAFIFAVVVDSPAALPTKSPVNDVDVIIPTFILVPSAKPLTLPVVFP